MKKVIIIILILGALFCLWYFLLRKKVTQIVSVNWNTGTTDLLIDGKQVKGYGINLYQDTQVGKYKLRGTANVITGESFAGPQLIKVELIEDLTGNIIDTKTP